MKVKNLSSSMRRGGFSLIELLVVVGIMGIMALILFPNIRNSWEKRKFENAARDVQATLQRAKMEAVKTKLNHRVKFAQGTSGWQFFIEKEASLNNWSMMSGFIKKTIPSEFEVTVNFPDQTVIFSPLGFIQNFNSLQNSITLQSPRLESYSQPDQRSIYVFAGGSTRYVKS